jgi:hypothetical protein
MELSSDFKSLCDEISQNIPSRLIFPEAEFGDFTSIEIILSNSKREHQEKIIVIGLSEPDENICWIESEKIQGWKWLMESCHDLLSAGYPGCIGCGGPNSEEEWNEVDYRSKRKLDE